MLFFVLSHFSCHGAELNKVFIVSYRFKCRNENQKCGCVITDLIFGKTWDAFCKIWMTLISGYVIITEIIKCGVKNTYWLSNFNSEAAKFWE